MKLRTLVAAIAVAAVPFAAQAEFTVGGDVTIAYSQDADGETSLGGRGSEVIFNASEEVNGLTWFGTFSVNVAGATVDSVANVEGDSGIVGGQGATVTSAGQLRSDDMYVGVKGGFGTIKVGDTDNGCDATDTGWVAPDEFLSHSSGGCEAGDQNNITYVGTSGDIKYAVSYSPDVDNGAANADEDTFAVGVKGPIGPVTVSVGYESESGVGENVVLGISGNLGPVALGIRASDADDLEDAHIGYTANYKTGNNQFYIGIGDADDTNDVFVGYQRAIGSKTSLVAEFVEDDDNEDTEIAIGMIHRF